MYAQDIVVATKKLQHFGFRSKIYAYFFLCASTLSLVLWAVHNPLTRSSRVSVCCSFPPPFTSPVSSWND